MENTYLRDGWNILDITVVLTAWLARIPGMPKISALRSFRVLRPLKTISKLKGVKLLVNCILRSLKGLASVTGFISFIIVLFAITGQSFWEGAQDKRCRVTKYPQKGEWIVDQDQTRLCGNPDSYSCLEDTQCPSNDQMSRDPFSVNKTQVYSPSIIHETIMANRLNDTISQGIPNWNDFLHSYLGVVTSITLEGWCPSMQNLWDSSG